MDPISGETCRVNTVTRALVLGKLHQWMTGELTPTDFHNWAIGVNSSPGTDFDDWEDDRRFSAAKESLTELEMLDINLVTAEDAPLFVEFLGTPPGQFEKGYISFISQLQNIDRSSRRKTLKDTEPYKKYCTDKFA